MRDRSRPVYAVGWTCCSLAAWPPSSQASYRQPIRAPEGSVPTPSASGLTSSGLALGINGWSWLVAVELPKAVAAALGRVDHPAPVAAQCGHGVEVTPIVVTRQPMRAAPRCSNGRGEATSPTPDATTSPARAPALTSAWSPIRTRGVCTSGGRSDRADRGGDRLPLSRTSAASAALRSISPPTESPSPPTFRGERGSGVAGRRLRRSGPCRRTSHTCCGRLALRRGGRRRGRHSRDGSASARALGPRASVRGGRSPRRRCATGHTSRRASAHR